MHGMLSAIKNSYQREREVTAKIFKMAAAGDEQINPDSPVVTFEMAWAKYPKKVAKKDAQKAWSKVDPMDYAAIVKAIDAQKATDGWRKDGGQFVPYFATWLRGERWTDEITDADLTMGQCMWNIHDTREPGKGRCSKQASREKNGVVYCAVHAQQVN